MTQPDATAQFTLTPALWNRALVLLNRPSRTPDSWWPSLLIRMRRCSTYG